MTTDAVEAGTGVKLPEESPARVTPIVSEGSSRRVREVSERFPPRNRCRYVAALLSKLVHEPFEDDAEGTPALLEEAIDRGEI